MTNPALFLIDGEELFIRKDTDKPAYNEAGWGMYTSDGRRVRDATAAEIGQYRKAAGLEPGPISDK